MLIRLIRGHQAIFRQEIILTMILRFTRFHLETGAETNKSALASWVGAKRGANED